MPCFKVEFSGHLYRKWPLGKRIKLADCCFTPGSRDREFIVHTEINAENKECARKNGLETCLDAVHLLEFCIGESVYLDERRARMSTKEGKGTTGWKSFSINAVLAEDSPLTKEQIKEVKMAQNTFKSEQNPKRKKWLIRAINWQALGRRETKSQVDRFLKFWIALEVLLEAKGEKLVSKVTDALVTLYPSCRRQKIDDVVGDIYGIRGKIVHSGFLKPQNVAEKLEQLEAILSDLLRKRLGLRSKALAQQYFL